MKLTVLNKTLLQLSTDMGAISPGQTIEVSGVSPEKCHKLAESMKPWVDSGKVELTVSDDADRLNSLEMYTTAEGLVLEGGGDLQLRDDLASTANGDGASLVAIEDSGSLFAAANAEAALAELASRQLIEIADPGTAAAIPVTRSGIVSIVTAAAETNTLANPTFLGQRLILACDVRSVGDRVVTAAAAINDAGNTVMTFGAARDTIELLAIKVAGALRWQVIANAGVALS